MSIIEGPIPSSTLSEAGASAGGESSSELASLQQQEPHQASSSSSQNNNNISKAAHGAIFGRSAGTSSSSVGALRIPARRCRSPILSHQDDLTTRRRPVVVAHEDDSLGHFVEQQWQSEAEARAEALRTGVDGGNPYHLEITRNHSYHHQVPTGVPLQIPPAHSVISEAPTALMIMRRRRSNSAGGDTNSGSNSNGIASSNNKKTINSSNHGKQVNSEVQQLPDSIPEGSPKTRPISHDNPVGELLNNNSGVTAEVWSANNPTQHPQLYHATDTRYNSPLNPASAAVHRHQAALELTARDRVRLEADHHGYYNTNSGQTNSSATALDYGYDYGGTDVGGYYGATPSFRGMSMPQLSMRQQGSMAQDDQRGVSRGMMDINSLAIDHQFSQTMIQRSQQQQQQQKQVSMQRMVGKASDTSPTTQTSNTQGRVYQERDYKNDRVWQEDDHMSRTSEKRRSCTSVDNTGGNQDSAMQNYVHVTPAPTISNRENDGIYSVNQVVEQGQQLQSQAARGHLKNQQPPNNLQRVPQGRVEGSSIDDHCIFPHPPGMSPYYHYHRQSPPPSTPGRPDPRERQNSYGDISSASSSVGGMMSIYPYGAPIMHPQYGLIYPSTPGVYPPHHIDPRHGGGMWINPYEQQQLQAHINMPNATDAVGNSMQDNTVEEKPHSNSSLETPSPTATSIINDTATQTFSSRVASNLISSAPANFPSVKYGKRVSFSTLHIRTYETILSDNPSCSSGPSVGLGWRYDPYHYTATVDEYEAAQAQLYGIPPGRTYECRPEDLVLQRFEREAILLNTGFSRQDLAESVRSTNKVKNKRRQTVHNLPVAFVEERLEALTKCLKRWVLKKERTRHMYDDWKGRQYSP